MERQGRDDLYNPQNVNTASAMMGNIEDMDVQNEGRHGEVGSECKLVTNMMKEWVMSKKFETFENAKRFYQEYAHFRGFKVRLDNIYRNKEGEVQSRIIVCSCKGKRDVEPKRQGKYKALTQFDCKASFRVRKNKKTGMWEVFRFDDDHNHDTFAFKYTPMHRLHRRISESDAAQMDTMQAYDIKGSQIYGCCSIVRRWTKNAKDVDDKNIGLVDDNDESVNFRFSKLIQDCMLMCNYASRSQDSFQEVTKSVQSIVVNLKNKYHPAQKGNVNIEQESSRGVSLTQQSTQQAMPSGNKVHCVSSQDKGAFMDALMVDQQNLIPSILKARTPLQSANSPFVVPTPSPPLAPSPMPGHSEKPGSGASSIPSAANFGPQHTGGAAAPAQSLAIGTPGLSPSPLLAEFSVPDGPHGNAPVTTSGKSAVTKQPLERLIKAVKSLSPNALSAAVSDISSVVHMIDRIAGSAPGNGSRAAVGEDLVAMTNCRLQARNFITQYGTKRMRRYTSALPLNVASSAGSMNDGIKQFTVPEASDLESTATSSVKKPRIEANHALLEEIQEINQRLMDTVVDISDEDVDPTVAAAAAEVAEGTIVKCSFIAVALSPSLKSQYASAQLSPIQPLRLLVPTNYPNCSPILLDKFPVEASKQNEDLSVKARSRLGISLRTLSEPMSLGDIARTWDVCARAVISEHAQQSGGGSFSSKYGTWENCLSAM